MKKLFKALATCAMWLLKALAYVFLSIANPTTILIVISWMYLFFAHYAESLEDKSFCYTVSIAAIILSCIARAIQLAGDSIKKAIESNGLASAKAELETVQMLIKNLKDKDYRIRSLQLRVESYKRESLRHEKTSEDLRVLSTERQNEINMLRGQLEVAEGRLKAATEQRVKDYNEREEIGHRFYDYAILVYPHLSQLKRIHEEAGYADGITAVNAVLERTDSLQDEFNYLPF